MQAVCSASLSWPLDIDALGCKNIRVQISLVDIVAYIQAFHHETPAGNHETMNVSGRFTYATPLGMAEFLEWHALQRLDANLRVC